MVRRIICELSRFEFRNDCKYIREQEAHDVMMDKLSVKEYKDPFEEKEIKEENKKRAKSK